MAGIPRQFWEGGPSLGQSPHDYVMNLIEDAAKNVEPIVAAKMNHVITSMHAVASDIGKLKLTIAQAHGVSFDDIKNEIETVLADLLEELQEQFPPPDQAPNHEERQASVSLVLRKVKEALIKLCVQYGMPEDQLRAHLDPIMEHVETIVVTLGASTLRPPCCASSADALLGDLKEQHPRLFRLLIITGVLLILPKYRCPLLRMFGIGPEGPIKGACSSPRTRIHICAQSLRMLVCARARCLCSDMHIVQFRSQCVSVSLRSYVSSVSFCIRTQPLSVRRLLSRMRSHSRHVSVYARTHHSLAGSVAAWAQSLFFGAYVPQGSWFSLLQSAGMTAVCGPAPAWETVIGLIMVVVGAGEVAGK